MKAPDRFEIVAPLPSSRHHLHVAVDRGSRPPHAVVLAFYPRAVLDDPARLERVSDEVERAAQLFHPNVLAPVGIEAVGNDLAAVTVWRDAITLREILDAGGRLPSDIAARIAADVCAGLAHAHGRPEPVVHGLLRPEAVLVDESGTAMVSGFGMPGGSGITDDLLGVADLLHECLVGEPPEDPSAPLEAPGVPESLAALVNTTRATGRESRPPTAEALAAAIAQAVPLPSRETVAAYLDAIVPAGSGLRAARRRKIETVLAGKPSVSREAVSEEISEHDIVGAVTPVPGAVAVPEPALASAPVAIEVDAPESGRADPPGDDASRSSVGPTSAPAASAPAPAPTPAPAAAPAPAPASALAAAPVAAPAPAASAAGSTTSTSAATSTWTGVAASAYPVALHVEPGAGALAPAPSREESGPLPTAPSVPPEPRGAAPARPERRAGPRVSLGVATAMCLAGVVIGFALARLAPPGNALDALTRFAPEARAPAAKAGASAAEARAPADTRPAEPALRAVPAVFTDTPPPAPEQPSAKPAPERKRSGVRPAVATADAKRSGMGVLDVTAPDGAEIWLDGRRIGTGSTRRQIPVGDHRVEVRHGGAAVGERFHVAPGESWTYAVTPQ